MTKETFFLLLRAILTVIGSYLIGKNVFGVSVDNRVWQTVLGIVLSLASFGWSIAEKSYTSEALISVARQVFTFVGGILISKGKLSPEKLESILGLVVTVFVILQSYVQKKQAGKIQTGEIQPHALTSIPSK